MRAGKTRYVISSHLISNITHPDLSSDQTSNISHRDRGQNTIILAGMFSAGDNGPFVGNIGNQHKLVPFILIIQLNTWMEIFSMELGEVTFLSLNCFMIKSSRTT